MVVVVGIIYSDPEGIWEVKKIDGDSVTVICIQDGNPNYGREFLVSLEEAEYFAEKGVVW